MASLLIFKWNYLEDSKRHIKDKMYIIGLEPYPDVTDSKGGQLILELSRLRDACILLAKHRPYREYPLNVGDAKPPISFSTNYATTKNFLSFYGHQVCT